LLYFGYNINLILIWASGIGKSNADVISGYKGGKGSKLKFKKLKKY